MKKTLSRLKRKIVGQPVVVNLEKYSYNNPARTTEIQEFQKKHGYSIVPVSYFEPIPDLRELDLNNEDSVIQMKKIDFEYDTNWLRKSGFDLLANLKKTLPSYLVENPMLPLTDMIVYARMIEDSRPKTIIEIGSGYSACLVDHLKSLLGLDFNLICIEPFPNTHLEKLASENKCTLIRKRVQDISKEESQLIGDMRENDILFIDTSHVSHYDSDTNFLFTDVLPLVKSGVNVHIHDIFLPYEYDKKMYFKAGRFYTEQYLVAAVLSNSDFYKPLFGSYYFWKANSLEEYGASFWMKRT